VRSESGGVTILMLAVLALVAVIGVGVASLGSLLAAREQAMGAAEAAALAAAVATYPPAASGDPSRLAAEYAGRNGAALESCRCPLDGSMSVRTVTVVTTTTRSVPVFGEVTIRGAARAEFDPMTWLG
jgi:Flp pilus assembly protein TadG